MSIIISPDFEATNPHIATIRQINQHGSRIFQGHVTTHDVIVVDYPAEKMLSWHQNEIRRQIGKACIRHLALLPKPFTEDSVRLLGIPLNKYDCVITPHLQLDLRIPINTHAVDPSLPRRELNIVPDWLVREAEHGIEIKFEQPEDLLERLEARYAPKTSL